MNNNVIIAASIVIVCYVVYQVATNIKAKVSAETLQCVSDTIDTTLDKIDTIIKLADAYVAWAKQFKSEESGEKKMELVVEKLAEIALKFDIDLSEDDLKAIAQRAYNMMENK